MNTPTLGSGRPTPEMDELVNLAIANLAASRAREVEELCESVMTTGAFARDIELRIWTDGFVEIA